MKNIGQTIVGTNSERLSLSTVNLDQLTRFIETDTGNTYQWMVSSWIASGPIAPATSINAVISSATQINAVMTPQVATAYQGVITASSVTITPTANTKIRKLKLALTENATLAVAGIDVVTVSLNGVTIYQTGIYIPAAALTSTSLLWNEEINFDDITHNSGTGNLVVSLSTALAGGAMYVNAWFV